MPNRTSKPQYRTLVKALDELAQAALFSWRNAGATPLLGSAHLYRQIENARDVVHRANAALAERESKAERKRRWAEERAGEFV